MPGWRPIFLAAALCLTTAACAPHAARAQDGREAPTSAQDKAETEDTIARGAYLARAGNCISCHTERGGTPWIGGRPFETPYGTIYSTNITPHEATGIGTWTDEAFLDAMRSGESPHGHLYPALPYPWFARTRTGDLLAIKAFLFSLKPVEATAPENELSFPFDQRWLLHGWDLLVDEGPFEPVAGQSEAWNRGAYLVEGLGHCGACHTQRNLASAPERDSSYTGEITEGWYAPNLTGSPDGLQAWSEDDLVRYLKYGHTPGFGSAVGPMHEVVANSTSHLTDTDLRAMAVYLKSVPARDDAIEAEGERAAQFATLASLRAEPFADPAEPAGARLYYGACASCHGPDGRGVKGAFPVLQGNSAVAAPVANNAIQVVLHGVVHDEGVEMPAYGPLMSDAQIAALVTYLIDRWGAGAPDVTAADVAGLRGEDSRE